MINVESDQKHLKTYTSFLLEAGQGVYSIDHLLNNFKLKYDSCLNYLTKPIVTSEKVYPSFNYPDKTHHVNWQVIHKIFNFLFGTSDDSITLDKIKKIFIY